MQIFRLYLHQKWRINRHMMIFYNKIGKLHTKIADDKSLLLPASYLRPLSLQLQLLQTSFAWLLRSWWTKYIFVRSCNPKCPCHTYTTKASFPSPIRGCGRGFHEWRYYELDRSTRVLPALDCRKGPCSRIRYGPEWKNSTIDNNTVICRGLDEHPSGHPPPAFVRASTQMTRVAAMVPNENKSFKMSDRFAILPCVVFVRNLRANNSVA